MFSSVILNLKENISSINEISELILDIASSCSWIQLAKFQIIEKLKRSLPVKSPY